MGWLYGWDSKPDLVRHITRESDNDAARHTIIKKAIRGNNLWTVMEIENKQKGTTIRLIVLYKLSSYDGDWGYKSISEDMGPYEVNCPLAYLDLVSPAEEVGSSCAEWRASVRRHHARVDGLKVGAYIALLPTVQVDGPMKVVSMRPFHAVDCNSGCVYRIKRSLIHSTHPTEEAARAATKARTEELV